ncbi:dethiobiotin synthase [Rhodococcus coprophilus]|uniref:dethiobiotin synthase n=1 Tax=Rhodococcus coprophilus TaxID=38310 RepID=UPI0034055C3D
MSILFVTGTSTGVGKTVVTAALASRAASRGLRVAVCKPAQTGVGDDEPGDLAEIVRLTGGGIDTVELARYPDPLAPDTAARRSGRALLDLASTADAVRRLGNRADLVLVEGAGGVLVRLGAAGFTLVDLAATLDAPAVVVAAASLGTLNHSALTVRALHTAGVECRGIVIGSSPATPDLAERCNVVDLPAVTGVPLLGAIPEGAGVLRSAEFVSAAPHWVRDVPV